MFTSWVYRSFLAIESPAVFLILEKEKHIAEDEDEEGEDGILIFAISSLIIPVYHTYDKIYVLYDKWDIKSFASLLLYSIGKPG